jgi:hypothetical protein
MLIRKEVLLRMAASRDVKYISIVRLTWIARGIAVAITTASSKHGCLLGVMFICHMSHKSHRPYVDKELTAVEGLSSGQHYEVLDICQERQALYSSVRVPG